MKRIILYALGFFLLPLLASAQTLNTLLANLATFLGNVIIPFLFGVAFLFFVFNTIKYFVVSAADQQAKEKARSFALYSVLAFVFIILFWGITNMLTSTIGLGGNPPEGYESDYVNRAP